MPTHFEMSFNSTFVSLCFLYTSVIINNKIRGSFFGLLLFLMFNNVIIKIKMPDDREHWPALA